MSPRLRSWLRTYLAPQPGSTALRAGSPSAEKDGPRPRAQRQTFQQQGKEHPPAPATRSHGRTGGLLPTPAPSASEAWLDCEIVPKSLLHPRLSPSPRHRAAASPGPSGFPAIWCIRGQYPAPSKGWILSRFLLFLSPGNPFLLNLAIWLCPLSVEGLPSSNGEARPFSLFSTRADPQRAALRGSVWCHRSASSVSHV